MNSKLTNWKIPSQKNLIMNHNNSNKHLIISISTVLLTTINYHKSSHKTLPKTQNKTKPSVKSNQNKKNQSLNSPQNNN
jgi:hypothetical protein